MVPAQATRKRRGAWYTPAKLVDVVVDGVVADLAEADRRGARHGPRPPVRVVDPACGDGRLLAEVAARIGEQGHTVELTGCDIDERALRKVDRRVRRIHGDALTREWGDERFDVVVGNPPFLSQMAATTTRGGSSSLGGGPYADAAAEFLALAMRLADPRGGCVGLVLPQSILAARDAGPVRAAIGRDADLTWSWWEPTQRHFDASVNVCALGFRRPGTGRDSPVSWTRVVTDRLGVPPVDSGDLATVGTVGDRADLNANFRDEYYALVPAVSDSADGPPLVTSGLIDPGVCHWGARTVRFAKHDFAHPRVDLARLEGRFSAWAARKLVPKVLVANQTRVIEAVADPGGSWLPGVPVTTVTPHPSVALWEVAAVLTSPVASVIAWHLAAGTGLSTTSLRFGPDVLGAVPWPRGELTEAVRALRDGAIVKCGELATAAYDVEQSAASALLTWWARGLPGEA